MTAKVVGRRVYLNEDGQLWLRPGDYGKERNGEWMARPPTEPEVHLAGSLKHHEVVEHEDGTITVSPSILITSEENDCKLLWHGYLERGVWRTA